MERSFRDTEVHRAVKLLRVLKLKCIIVLNKTGLFTFEIFDLNGSLYIHNSYST